jgi:excisionase family DNA binding protein
VHKYGDIADVVPNRLETADEIAGWLHVPTSWVREQARRNAIPCVRLGRYIRFHRPAVADALNIEPQPRS